MQDGFAIVVDIGKTLSKVSLWSRDGRMIDRATRPNAIVEEGGIRRLDAVGIGQFLRQSLDRMGRPTVEYIVPVAHGAAVAALSPTGLAIAPLDYEQDLPADVLDEYRQGRTPFTETGSPALPGGLNFGAQLFWLDRLHPNAMASATLVPWAQYWAWFLSGEAVSEVTSLGCHSDLWNPTSGKFSTLALAQGWAGRFAPLASASNVIGLIRPEIAASSGLSPQTKVLAGIHDSNAALLAARGFAEIANNEATVLSTGTWFIAMRLAKQALAPASLPEDRDCLVNVDAFGQPLPSARFMGGREIELLVESDTRSVDTKKDQPHLLAAVEQVVASGAMVLPTLVPGNGPFPRGQGGWLKRPADWNARRAGACLYAALVADAALDLIGTKERALIEGRFAAAEVFVRALASLRPGTAIYTANAQNDVSFGALRLINPELVPEGKLARVAPLPCDLSAYRRHWQTSTMAAA
ncbi:MAG: FGGY family carbohydrate kinase [Pseudomonadota bacterium]